MTIFFTTPAATAWSSRSYSTAAARSSFSCYVSPTFALKSSKNVFYSVYSLHLCAELAQLATPVPSTHLYTMLGFYMVVCCAAFCYIHGRHIYVVTNTWSEKRFNVVGSQFMFYVALFVMIRSITDLSVPLVNVCSAGGPGYIPFRICHSHCLHILISHGARAFV